MSNAADGLADVRAIIVAIMHQALGNPPGVIARTFEWVLAATQTNAHFLRLPLFTYQATRSAITPANARDSARISEVIAAWHLLYCAARLLDDVEDRERHNPISADPAQVINAAATLIFAAQLVLASTEDLALDPQRALAVLVAFNTTTARMASGQANDLALDVIALPSPEDIERIAEAKSGEFFALACRTGAMLSGTGPDEITACTTFGYNLGVLLQIGDDFRAVWTPQRHSDLITLRRTLPVVYGLSVADPLTRQHLEICLAQSRADSEALVDLQSTLAKLGALHYITFRAGLRYTRAREALLNLPRPSQAQYELLTILDTVFPAVAMDQWSSSHVSTASIIDPNSGGGT